MNILIIPQNIFQVAAYPLNLFTSHRGTPSHRGLDNIYSTEIDMPWHGDRRAETGILWHRVD